MLDDSGGNLSRCSDVDATRKTTKGGEGFVRRAAAWLGNTESQWATVIAAALALDLAIAQRAEAIIAPPPEGDDAPAPPQGAAATPEALDQAIVDALTALDAAIAAGPSPEADDTDRQASAAAGATDRQDQPESTLQQVASAETPDHEAQAAMVLAAAAPSDAPAGPETVSVVNRGAIVALENAIEAISQTGDAMVDSVGNLVSLARAAIYARAAGSVSVESQGDLYGAESGVSAHAEQGDVTVTHKGSIFAGALSALAPSASAPMMFARSMPAPKTVIEEPQRLFSKPAPLDPAPDAPAQDDPVQNAAPQNDAPVENAPGQEAPAQTAAVSDAPEWASGPLPVEPEFLESAAVAEPAALPAEPGFQNDPFLQETAAEQTAPPSDPGAFLLDFARAVQTAIWDLVDNFDFQPDPEDPPSFPVGVDAVSQHGSASVAIEGSVIGEGAAVHVEAEADAAILLNGDAASVTGAALFAQSWGRDVDLDIDGAVSSRHAVGVFASARSGDVELEIEGRVSGGHGGLGEAVDGVRIADARGQIEIEIEGTVRGGEAQAGGSAAAIHLDSSIHARTDVEIENEGRLFAGTVDGVRDAALRLAGGDDRVDNSGSIFGDVLLGAGDDVFRNSRGGFVDGATDGGAGDDIFFAGDLADVFRMSFGAGSDTVYDLGASDMFDFRDLADYNAAGADVVWEVDVMDDGQEYGRLTFFDGVEDVTLTVYGDHILQLHSEDVFLWA